MPRVAEKRSCMPGSQTVLPPDLVRFSCIYKCSSLYHLEMSVKMPRRKRPVNSVSTRLKICTVGHRFTVVLGFVLAAREDDHFDMLTQYLSGNEDACKVWS